MPTTKRENEAVTTAAEGNTSAPPDRGPGDSQATVVEMQGVSKTYPGGTVPAVADMNMAIHEGEFFSILGSSGSGKTTTLRLIAGFEQPSSGSVLLDGVDATGVPPFRRDVNTVFQNYALFPHMKVEANVAYPLKMAGTPKREIKPRVREALERVSMTGFEKRLPHQLSGGQRQRIALARALIGRPRLLLLDEPLGALDLKLRESMLLVLRNLQREVGITFIYVTHDQSEALAMSDRLAVMSDGRIEQLATPTEIYDRPRNLVRRRIHRQDEPARVPSRLRSARGRRGRASCPRRAARRGHLHPQHPSGGDRRWRGQPGAWEPLRREGRRRPLPRARARAARRSG